MTNKNVKYYLLRVLEIFILGIWVFPLIWMLITSLHLENELISKSFHFFPTNPTLENYRKAIFSTYIMRWLLNSFLVSSFTMIITLVVDAPIAYAFAKIKFKGKTILFWFVVFLFFVNTTTTTNTHRLVFYVFFFCYNCYCY
jgi:ABC-type glycerol-3-phosphate transport system permease component